MFALIPRRASLIECFALVALCVWSGSANAQSAMQSPLELIESQVPAALRIRDAYLATDSIPSSRTLHIVYWTPKDRDPIDQYRERLSRVLFDIREFYRNEMKRLGIGDITFGLETEADGLLKLHVVRGKENYERYNVESGNKIRNECLPVLSAAGIKADRETIVIFCNMSNWDPDAKKISQNSPYYAGGGIRGGTAWQVDSALLDSERLTEKQPMVTDGQYGRISVGKYNSIFVGGVCHELGHALGLPHDMERPDEGRMFGTSLMGSGNRTYGEDRRGEGRGSFLTFADGLRLASHPLFTKNEKGINLRQSAKISDITVALDESKKSFEFKGRVTADPPAYAMIGYLDPSGGSDYDATTVTAVPDESGRFVLKCHAFKNGKGAMLRIVACQSNGGRIDDTVLQIPYAVDADGVVDISMYMNTLRLADLVAAVKANDLKGAKGLLADIEQKLTSSREDSELREVAQSLVRSMRFEPGPAPSRVDSDEAWLSDLAVQNAKVGWLKPMQNRLPNDSVLLSVGGKLFSRGLYAHAPSTYAYDLGARWKKLTGHAGVADGHGGSVVFVVKADGKELWRSKKTAEGTLLDFDLDVENAKQIVFEVEDAGDGNGADWGVWTDLQIHRSK